MMFFHDILKIESAEYNLPGVIYEAGENRLNVYAYTDVELTDNSDLFAAPFFNVTGARASVWAPQKLRSRKT